MASAEHRLERTPSAETESLSPIPILDPSRFRHSATPKCLLKLSAGSASNAAARLRSRPRRLSGLAVLAALVDETSAFVGRTAGSRYLPRARHRPALGRRRNSFGRSA